MSRHSDYYRPLIPELLGSDMIVTVWIKKEDRFELWMTDCVEGVERLREKYRKLYFSRNPMLTDAKKERIYNDDVQFIVR